MRAESVYNVKCPAVCIVSCAHLCGQADPLPFCSSQQNLLTAAPFPFSSSSSFSFFFSFGILHLGQGL